MEDMNLFEQVMQEMDEAIECTDGNKRFAIDTDQKAEWALRRIAEEMAEYDRIAEVCNAEIARYTNAMTEAAERMNRKTDSIRMMLGEYMQSVPAKETKTQRSYILPSAKLIIKRKNPKIVRDDAQLLTWLRENAPEYIAEKVTYTPAWAQLKDTLTVSGGEYVNADGVIVDGVHLEPQEDEFVIQFK